MENIFDNVYPAVPLSPLVKEDRNNKSQISRFIEIACAGMHEARPYGTRAKYQGTAGEKLAITLSCGGNGVALDPVAKQLNELNKRDPIPSPPPGGNFRIYDILDGAKGTVISVKTRTSPRLKYLKDQYWGDFQDVLGQKKKTTSF